LNNGVELFRLYQRKTPNGDAYFFGTWGDALVSVTRDQLRRDVWVVAVHSPSVDKNSCNRPPMHAIEPPAEEGDDDDGDHDEGDADDPFDDIPEDVALPAPLGRR
jgi:hypothetical protein